MTTNRDPQRGDASAPRRAGYKVGLLDCLGWCTCPSPVRHDCGCVNHNGGEITYCPTHDAATEMLALLRTFVGTTDATVAEATWPSGPWLHFADARALLARIEGR